MTLAGVDQLDARPIFAALEAEIARLEKVFSLYRDDSALVRLNRTGRLSAPPAELLEVLGLCDALHAATEGAFDPTVQPLWTALAEGGDPAAARGRIGWRGVSFDAGEVRLRHAGMALTLNGIAQGYVTDRIAAALRRRGFGDVLVDIGEVAALGRRADGAPWQAGVATPDGRIVQRVALRDRALATSAPRGTVLDRAAGQGHILDPRGAGAPARALVSVSAPRADIADGLSTALCLMEAPAAEAAIASFGDARLEKMV
jgi:thiamine biosynthesis lipoprotein